MTDSTRPKTRLQGLLRRLIAPGARLMFLLPLRAKLALMALALLAPMALLLADSLQEMQHKRAQARAGQQGVQTLQRLLAVMVELQRHRGLTARVLAGDTGAIPQREDTRRALKAALQATDAQLAQPGAIGLGDDWPALRQRALALAEGQHPLAAQAAFAVHSQAVETVRQLMLIDGERSGLVFDGHPQTQYLGDLLIQVLPRALESAAVARGLGGRLLVRGEASDEERAQMLAQAGQIQDAVAGMANRIAGLDRSGAAALQTWAGARDGLEQFSRKVSALFNVPQPAGDATLYFDQATQVVDRTHALGLEALEALQQAQAARDAATARAQARLLGACVVALLLIGYLMLAFDATFQAALRALLRGTDEMARGNLAHRTQVRGRDELATIGGRIDATCAQISGLVAEIRSSASLVNLAGEQVADGSQRLSQRTDDQAGSLRASVDTIGQLSQAVAQNAEAARTLDRLTEDLFRQAEDGHAAMAQALEAMGRMQEASQRMAEVVTVIDDVAFQTGMLSLNAAVEAARAGDAGKGFAVVAGEVRQLAQRCADSADEIRNLIRNTAEQSDGSAQRLQHVAVALDTIVGGVREVSVKLRAISTASTQQSAGLDEVTQNVGNLDKITQENAALVEMSATASSALVERAGKLREAVGSMRLRQASADEAHALVLQAVAHIEAAGRERAFADFHDPAGAYIDRDLYIFVMDRNGLITVFGSRPELVGEPAASIPGIEAQSFLEQAWAAADAGGGWIQYEVLSPGTKAVTPKESFILPLGDGEFIGCGAYRREGSGSRGAQAKKRPTAWLAA